MTVVCPFYDFGRIPAGVPESGHEKGRQVPLPPVIPLRGQSQFLRNVMP
jgi:hypothetical protein